MATLTVKLPDALQARLAEAVRRRGSNRSAWVRDAIEAALAEDRGTKKGSALDQAVDLAGCVTGPADLSHGKRHLRGFGRDG